MDLQERQARAKCGQILAGSICPYLTCVLQDPNDRSDALLLLAVTDSQDVAKLCPPLVCDDEDGSAKAMHMIFFQNGCRNVFTCTNLQFARWCEPDQLAESASKLVSLLLIAL